MSWQPGSNGRLASGFADIATMREQGMTIGVGLDDQACTDISDPWQNMRMGMYGLRAQTGDPLSMMPEEMLRLHTLGSADVLGIEDRVGSLEVGKFADFLVVEPAQAGHRAALAPDPQLRARLRPAQPRGGLHRRAPRERGRRIDQSARRGGLAAAARVPAAHRRGARPPAVAASPQRRARSALTHCQAHQPAPPRCDDGVQVPTFRPNTYAIS